MGCPTRTGSGVDMTDVSDLVRPGCRIAKDWATIPPIETPSTCALGIGERAEQRRRVVGEVVDQVRDGRRVAEGDREGVRLGEGVEVRREARIAVVEPDGAEAQVDEGGDERGVPRDELRPVAVDEQQRDAVGVAVDLVAELEPVGLRLCGNAASLP